jgi:hypothetical protein
MVLRNAVKAFRCCAIDPLQKFSSQIKTRSFEDSTKDAAAAAMERNEMERNEMERMAMKRIKRKMIFFIEWGGKNYEVRARFPRLVGTPPGITDIVSGNREGKRSFDLR